MFCRQTNLTHFTVTHNAKFTSMVISHPERVIMERKMFDFFYKAKSCRLCSPLLTQPLQLLLLPFSQVSSCPFCYKVKMVTIECSVQRFSFHTQYFNHFECNIQVLVVHYILSPHSVNALMHSKYEV